jgi:transcriptional regulator with XRE-family HTH domain
VYPCSRARRSGGGRATAGATGAAGVPVGTIRDYEQGKRDPLLSNAQRLAGALGVSPDVFPGPDGGGARKEEAKPPEPRARKPKGK